MSLKRARSSSLNETDETLLIKKARQDDKPFFQTIKEPIKNLLKRSWDNMQDVEEVSLPKRPCFFPINSFDSLPSNENQEPPKSNKRRRDDEYDEDDRPTKRGQYLDIRTLDLIEYITGTRWFPTMDELRERLAVYARYVCTNQYLGTVHQERHGLDPCMVF